MLVHTRKDTRHYRRRPRLRLTAYDASTATYIASPAGRRTTVMVARRPSDEPYLTVQIARGCLIRRDVIVAPSSAWPLPLHRVRRLLRDAR